jgi:hypothetical protein
MATVKTTHTDGAWKFQSVPGASRYEVTADNGRVIVAETISRGGPEALANARLMACAPDMEKVLRELVSTLSACVDENGAWSDFPAANKRCLLESAKAALGRL